MDLDSSYFFQPGAGSFDFALPTRIIFGEGTVGRLASEVKKLGGSRVLVITSAGMPGRQSFKELISTLQQAGIEYGVFTAITPDPSIEDVEACLKAAKSIKPDCVAGFGGGSALDVAKKVAMKIGRAHV